MRVRKTNKDKTSINRKRKNKDKARVGSQKPTGEEVYLEEKNGELIVMHFCIGLVLYHSEQYI